MKCSGRLAVRLVTATAMAVLAGCGQGDDATPGTSASCASEVEYDGHTYSGHGDLERDPETTGRTETGVRPGCDDGNGAEPDRQVEVAELADLPMSRALLVDGTLFVRSDQPFPEKVRGWFVAPTCDTAGTFELRGPWLGVRGPNKPRFHGDLRPPYRLDMHVTRGPAAYVGSTLKIDATTETDPALGPRNVKTSLWVGGGLTARVRCEDGRFVAVALATTPG